MTCMIIAKVRGRLKLLCRESKASDEKGTKRKIQIHRRSIQPLSFYYLLKKQQPLGTLKLLCREKKASDVKYKYIVGEFSHYPFITYLKSNSL